MCYFWLGPLWARHPCTPSLPCLPPSRSPRTRMRTLRFAGRGIKYYFGIIFPSSIITESFHNLNMRWVARKKYRVCRVTDMVCVVVVFPLLPKAILFESSLGKERKVGTPIPDRLRPKKKRGRSNLLTRLVTLERLCRKNPSACYSRSLIYKQQSSFLLSSFSK